MTSEKLNWGRRSGIFPSVLESSPDGTEGSEVQRLVTGERDRASQAELSAVSGQLPDYAPSQLAYHFAFETTLRSIVQRLPVARGERVLDLATGDGTFALLLAERGAIVTALDCDPNFLRLASARARRRGLPIEFCQGDAHALPFEDEELDGAFCAQSFFDLQGTTDVLRELKRVVRPGGWVGVMENDVLHHLVLPWPADLELKIRAAQLEIVREQSNEPDRFYLGRRLVRTLQGVGLEAIRQRSFSSQVAAPLSPNERAFIEFRMNQLTKMVRERLSAEQKRQLDELCAANSDGYLLDQPWFAATVLDFLAWGRLGGAQSELDVRALKTLPSG